MPEITIVIHSCANCKHFSPDPTNHYGDCTWKAQFPIALSYVARRAFRDWTECPTWNARFELVSIDKPPFDSMEVG